MFTRIVVPLDGSRFSEAALAPARELARIFHAHLLVVRAESPGGLPALAPSRDLIDLEALNEADAYLHEVVTALRESGQDAEMVLYIAPPGAGIARTAELDHADLIVMATHLRWQHGVQGASTTLAVLKRSRVPILAWHVGATTDEQPVTSADERPPIFRRPESPLVVPLDGSIFAEGALPLAEELARAFGTYLVLVRATENEAQQPEAEEYLRRIAGQIVQRGGHVITRVESGIPLSVIESTWRDYDASLILLASHGTHAGSGTFLGSVAASLVEEVEAPVLVVRPQVEVTVGI